MKPRAEGNYQPPEPAYHRVDIVAGEQEVARQSAPTARIDHVVTVSQVHHRVDNPARIGFGFGVGFFAARALIRLGLFLVLCVVLLTIVLRALAQLGV